MTAIAAVLLSAALAPTTVASASPIYDAAADFSSTANPTGVWSYGVSTTLAGTVSLYTTRDSSGGIDYWGTGSFLIPPEVFKNSTNNIVTYRSIVLQPQQLALHPGLANEYSVVRFTAPSAGNYSLAASFIGVDTGGLSYTSTDVHILANNISLFTGSVLGYGDKKTFAYTMTLNIGDRLDFSVGNLTGNYHNDSTGLSATITKLATPIPEIDTAGLGLILALVTGSLGYLEQHRSGEWVR